jgi:hypothetical protein
MQPPAFSRARAKALAKVPRLSSCLLFPAQAEAPCGRLTTVQFIKRFRHAPDNKNVTQSQSGADDMLEKIAATNDFTIGDVVRLFLIEALPEPHWKLGTLDFSQTRRLLL